MRYLDFKMMRTALVALAMVLALAACHDGSGAVESEEGGDDAVTTEGGFSEGQIAAEDGLMLEFTEPMDTASVESHLLAYSGDVDVLASISEGKAVLPERLDMNVLWQADDTRARVKIRLPHCESATVYLNPEGVFTRAGAELGGDIRRAVITRGPNYVDFDGDCKGDIAFGYTHETFFEYDFFILTFGQIKSLFLGANVDPIDVLLGRPGIYQYGVDAQGNAFDLGFIDGGQTGVPGFGTDAGVLLFSGYTDVPEEMAPVSSIGSEAGKNLRSFSSLGDVDGDGAWDMSATVTPSESVVHAYVIMGSPGILDLGVAPLISEFDVQYLEYIYTDVYRPFCGHETTARHAVGDFDGDGHKDMTICHTTASAGEDTINVIMGSEEFVLSKFGDMAVANSYDDSGFTIQMVEAGDVYKGDLYSDLIVTYVEALQYPKLNANVGAGALIIPGSADFGANIVASEAAAVDIAMPDCRQVTVSVLGDINADGLHDFSLTAKDNDSPVVSTYIFLGRSEEDWQAKEWSYADADYSFEGSYDPDLLVIDSFNYAKKAGDLNNDGIDDIVVERYYDDSRAKLRYEYYYLGGTSGGLRKLVRINTYYETLR